jgi:serine/threonine protein kinase
MGYAKDGDLRKYLQSNKLKFEDKLDHLCQIASGLNSIHEQRLVHRDFHPGNILNKKDLINSSLSCYITDLGLCRPANETNPENVYGVCSYMAPEVLRKKSYTPASDIYSLGIAAYELLANSYPYPGELHNLGLAICEGLRPNIDELKIPQLLKDLIKQC